MVDLVSGYMPQQYSPLSDKGDASLSDNKASVDGVRLVGIFSPGIFAAGRLDDTGALKTRSASLALDYPCAAGKSEGRENSEDVQALDQGFDVQGCGICNGGACPCSCGAITTP